MEQHFIEIGVFSPQGDGGLSFFFEPRCEELQFSAGQSVSVYARCPDGEDKDLPAEIERDGDKITVFSKSGNAVWYVRSDSKIASTLDLAYGEEVSKKIEGSLFDQNT